jgi:hypothetical protein
LGKAVACEDLGRNDDDRVIRPAFAGVVDSAELTPSSSTDVVDCFIEAEIRLLVRVAVFESPMLSRLNPVDFPSPMDERPTVVKVLL